MSKKGVSLRTRLQLVFLPLFLVVSLSYFFLQYNMIKNNTDEMIYSELKELSSSISITFKSLINFAIQNYLQSTADKNKKILEDYHDLLKLNKFTKEEVDKRIQKLLVEEVVGNKVGQSGSVFVVDAEKFSNKNPEYIIKPSYELSNRSINTFVKRALDDINGYFEFDWEPIDKKGKKGTIIKKSVYFTYIINWNWILFVSSNKNEVENLINIEDISDDILTLRIKQHGFASIMDLSGNLLVHPWNQKENVFDSVDANGKQFYKEMINNKNGKLEYYWDYGTGVKKNIAYYKYVPDMKLIIWITTAIEEHYGVLFKSRNISLIILAISIILFIPIIMFFSSSLVKPLTSIIGKINKITDSMDFSEKVDVSGVKEVVALGKSFNFMIKELDKYRKDLVSSTREQAKYEAELSTAQAVQKALIPAFIPKVKGYEFSAFYKSASSVGGDWYGFIRDGDDYLYLMIGDATGHGTPAALLTAGVSGSCDVLSEIKSNYPDVDLTPGLILEYLNKIVFNMGKDNLLMTFFVLRLELETGQILCANAGHNFPIFCYNNEKNVRKFKVLTAVGSRLGDTQGYKYKDFEHDLTGLAHGDDTGVIVLYTDGLTECINEEHKQYGAGRFKRNLKKLDLKISIDDIRDKIVNDALAFANDTPLDDDLTMVVMKYGTQD